MCSNQPQLSKVPENSKNTWKFDSISYSDINKGKKNLNRGYVKTFVISYKNDKQIYQLTHPVTT